MPTIEGHEYPIIPNVVNANPLAYSSKHEHLKKRLVYIFYLGCKHFFVFLYLAKYLHVGYKISFW